MCMQCVGAVGTACQAATLVGGPWVTRHWRQMRDTLGLADVSVAAVERRQLIAAARARTPVVHRRPGRAAPMLARTAPPPSPVPYWQVPPPPRRARASARPPAPVEDVPNRGLAPRLRVAVFAAAVRM